MEAPMAVAADTVTVYTTTTCPWCTRAKEYLRQKGVPFQEKNIEHDRAAAQEVMRRSGQMGVPVITAGDEVIVGFDRPRLDRLAQKYAPPPPPIDPALRPKIGVRVKDGPGGAEVGVVHPGGPGEQAGLRVGDLIVEIHGRPVRSAVDLETVMGSLTPAQAAGQTIAVDVRRNGKPVRLRLPV
jgi:glutaredoxin-like YruB-family protein